MYQSPTEARSDFFLTGAVFVFGPVMLSVLVGVLRLGAIPGLGDALPILIVFSTTALVPILLMRYRQESLRSLGFAGDPSPFVTGIVAALPMVAATMVVSLVVNGSLLAGLPVLNIGSSASFLLVVRRLVFWLGFMFLLVYVINKARHAFRPLTVPLREIAWQTGVGLVGAALGSSLLLLVTGADPLLLVAPVGVAGFLGLVYLWTEGRFTTDRWTVWAPLLVASLGFLVVTVQGEAFLAGLRSAALVGTVALVVVLIMETRRPADTAFGAGLALALLTNLGGVL